MHRYIFIAYDDFSLAGKCALCGIEASEGPLSLDPSCLSNYPLLSAHAELRVRKDALEPVYILFLNSAAVDSLWTLTINLMDWLLQLEKDLCPNDLQSVIILSALHLPISSKIADLSKPFLLNISNTLSALPKLHALQQFRPDYSIQDPFLSAILYLTRIEQPERMQIHGIVCKSHRPGKAPLYTGARVAIAIIGAGLASAIQSVPFLSFESSLAYAAMDADTARFGANNKDNLMYQ